jgi:hypothetical protein
LRPCATIPACATCNASPPSRSSARAPRGPPAPP